MTDDRLPPPPVEPLSDLSWARLERQLWTALDAPAAPTAAPRAASRWRWPVLAAGVVAAAAAIALAWPSPAPTPTPPRAVASFPSRIATGPAPTDLSFGDAAIRLAPSSTLFLGGDDRRGIELLLERGQASFEVAPRAGRAPFVVNAGAVRVTVIGTGFAVTRVGDTALVDVRHGVVEVVAEGRRDLVRAGQSWSRDGVTSTQIAASTASATAPIAVDVVTVDRPSPPTPSAPRPSAPRAATPSVTPNAPRVATPPPTAPTAGPDAKTRFAEAAAMEATDPARAMTTYLALAGEPGPWAANGLFAAARLAFDRGQHVDAKRLATRYLARFPHGTNAVDARTILERLTDSDR